MQAAHMANLDPEDLDGHELDDEWLSKEELLERRANNVSKTSHYRIQTELMSTVLNVLIYLAHSFMLTFNFLP